MTLEDDLRHFTGSTRYFRHPLGIVYTEGIQYLAEHAGAYWLIDVVASYQPRLRSENFQLWEIATQTDRTGVVTMRADTDEPELVRQDLEYTDFPLREFSFYLVDGTMLLKSEY